MGSCSVSFCPEGTSALVRLQWALELMGFEIILELDSAKITKSLPLVSNVSS